MMYISLTFPSFSGSVWQHAQTSFDYLLFSLSPNSWACIMVSFFFLPGFFIPILHLFSDSLTFLLLPITTSLVQIPPFLNNLLTLVSLLPSLALCNWFASESYNGLSNSQASCQRPMLNPFLALSLQKTKLLPTVFSAIYNLPGSIPLTPPSLLPSVPLSVSSGCLSDLYMAVLIGSV